MKKFFPLLLASLAFFFTPYFTEAKSILISTTTSTENSGLLNYLLPKFTADTGIDVKIMAKGTGAAIKDGVEGNVDAILVHDTRREEEFIAKGYGIKRYAIMYNDFVLLGPKEDKANARQSDTIFSAFEKIAQSKEIFISRGDDSGTHSKERKVWAKTDTYLQNNHPADKSWYKSIGQGMGKTILMAEEMQAYTLSDRGTFYTLKYGQNSTELEIIFEDPYELYNPYGYIPVNPLTHKHVNAKAAQILGEWLISSKGKEAIAGYKIQDKQLFFPVK